MSKNKTEQPTRKKQREARKKGQVAYSSDASSAAVFGVGFGVMMFSAATFFGAWNRMMHMVWSDLHCPFILNDGVNRLLSVVVSGSAVVMVPAFCAGILVGYLQVGPLIRPIKVDVEKLNPVQGAKGMFSGKRLFELFRTAIKLSVYGGVVGLLLWKRILPASVTYSVNVETWILFCARITETVMIYTIFIAIFYGVSDYFLQKRFWLNDLKMTRDEVQREYRESEGDPLMKGLRKQQYQEILQSCVTDRISRSRLVVVNPTRYAVALEYNDSWEGAPRIAAKGFMETAVRIRRLARDSNVPVLRHPPLARQLFKLSIDQEVPEELFRAVAELIVYVARLSESERVGCQ